MFLGTATVRAAFGYSLARSLEIIPGRGEDAASADIHPRLPYYKFPAERNAARARLTLPQPLASRTCEGFFERARRASGPLTPDTTWYNADRYASASTESNARFAGFGSRGSLAPCGMAPGMLEGFPASSLSRKGAHLVFSNASWPSPTPPRDRRRDVGGQFSVPPRPSALPGAPIDVRVIL